VSGPSWSVVIPTLGRPSLAVLLTSLAGQQCQPADVFVVDDRPDAKEALDLSAHPRATVVAGTASGPAAARNRGWWGATTEWVVFVDDDVVLPEGWSTALVEDLRNSGPHVGGSQAHITVPLPTDRRPTDWERGTAGLMEAQWVTAEMAYRRAALEAVGGFDERFPRAYREDSDLALRVRRAGWELQRGSRRVVHPVRPSDAWASVRQQRGNADDALMRALHGPDWRADAGCPAGRLPGHLATVGAALALGAALVGRRHRLASALAAGWAGLTCEFALRRVLPGPRTPDEVRAMVATSVVIPFAAAYHRLRGALRWRSARPWASRVRAVLLDRDGTLIHDVPYNHDPALVRPLAGAAEALDRLRGAGLPVGVVTNQSAIGRGLATAEQVAAVNAEVERQLGPFDTWQVCPHVPSDACACRKPEPGLVLDAAEELGVPAEQVVVVGDIGSDVAAAAAAGARGLLVPTPVTRRQEVRAAAHRARDLGAAVDQILGAR
jgi:histidinol-phosphate phosphatase family protein